MSAVAVDVVFVRLAVVAIMFCCVYCIVDSRLLLVVGLGMLMVLIVEQILKDFTLLNK